MTYELLAADNCSEFKIFNLLYSDKSSLQECCSVICAQYEVAGDELIIASFVLSCRFFARGLEYFFLRKIWERYQSEKLSIVFRKTRKNIPSLEFINSIACDSIVTTPVSGSPNESMKLSIDKSRLNALFDKFTDQYAQF